MNKNLLIFFFLFGLIGVTSCDQNRLFEEYTHMQLMQWSETDTVSFIYEPVERNPMAFLAVRYNDSYDYHNLYVKYQVVDSLDSVREENLINLQLFDPKSGKPQGDGFGNTYTLYHQLPIKNWGNHYRFIQYMRQPELSGIEAVGLKVERD
ncbi:MAG TPA: gliding motility lipoprotein GldH [Anditalea sp.]|nr:gliding motility lipoprotein GldH [Anditalea sp.]